MGELMSSEVNAPGYYSILPFLQLLVCSCSTVRHRRIGSLDIYIVVASIFVGALVHYVSRKFNSKKR